MKSVLHAPVALAAIALLASPAASKEETHEEYLERLEEEKERMTAQKDLLEARTTYIEALPLPGFENTTKLENDGGKLEATMLSAEALGHAASSISGALKNWVGDNGLAILENDEAFSVLSAKAIEYEIASLQAEFISALAAGGDGLKDTDGLLGGSLGLPGGIALASKLIGMLGSETTISYKKAEAADEAMLVAALAGMFSGKDVYTTRSVTGLGAQGKTILAHFEALEELARQAKKAQATLAAVKKPKSSQKRRLARLSATLERFSDFEKSVIPPDDKGLSPLFRAARDLDLHGLGRPVLRVRVAEAGGSLINSKNIGTFFGADPLRISGGAVVTYTLTDPTKGSVIASGVMHCATAKTSIRAVHRRSYRKAKTPCRWAR